VLFANKRIEHYRAVVSQPTDPTYTRKTLWKIYFFGAGASDAAVLRVAGAIKLLSLLGICSEGLVLLVL
jgi:hypothetical protein